MREYLLHLSFSFFLLVKFPWPVFCKFYFPCILLDASFRIWFIFLFEVHYNKFLKKKKRVPRVSRRFPLILGFIISWDMTNQYVKCLGHWPILDLKNSVGFRVIFLYLYLWKLSGSQASSHSWNLKHAEDCARLSRYKDKQDSLHSFFSPFTLSFLQ